MLLDPISVHVPPLALLAPLGEVSEMVLTSKRSPTENDGSVGDALLLNVVWPTTVGNVI
jgi:hypothetical protein